jgi:hypothetical protein
MKILLVGAELFRADKRTDNQTDIRDETNSRFSRFCEGAYKGRKNDVRPHLALAASNLCVRQATGHFPNQALLFKLRHRRHRPSY